MGEKINVKSKRTLFTIEQENKWTVCRLNESRIPNAKLQTVQFFSKFKKKKNENYVSIYIFAPLSREIFTSKERKYVMFP